MVYKIHNEGTFFAKVSIERLRQRAQSVGARGNLAIPQWQLTYGKVSQSYKKKRFKS
jgi:hypothetical protein